MNKLYVCTTNTCKEKGWLKIGQSKNPRARIKSGQTFSWEKIFIIKELNLPDNLQDHDIHEWLRGNGKKPLPFDGGREWFEASLADVERAYNYLTEGTARAYTYSLRSEQKEAVAKAIKWFNRENKIKRQVPKVHRDRFLLNAKMRFGKCFTTLHIAKKMNAKRTLVITYKPEVLSEWLEVIDDHMDFKEWVGVLARKGSKNRALSLNEDGSFPAECKGAHVVACVSLQDLWIDKDGATKKRLSKLIEEKWDLIVFDEVHYGGITSRARDIIDKLSNKNIKRIDLSGTPFRLLQLEEFCQEQVFTYSYLDEHAKKIKEGVRPAGEAVYGIFPDLNFSTIDITEKDLKEDLLTFRDDDFLFSLNKLFSAYKDPKTKRYEFLHKTAVESFVEGLRKKTKDATSISVFGAVASILNIPSFKRHSIWWVDSVNTAKAMVSLLREHEYFRKFEIVDASGSGNKHLLDDMPDVTFARDKKHVMGAIKHSQDNNDSLGTITVTVKRFLVGVTVREWDSILVLNDIEAPEEYYQAIFRIQSPWVDDVTNEVVKKSAWIFDFSLTRCLTLKINLAASIAAEKTRRKKLEKTGTKDHLRTTIEDLIDSISLKSFVDGKLKPDKVTADEVFKVMSLGVARASLARKITSDTLVQRIPSELLEKNSKLEEILKKIKGYRTQDVSSNHVTHLAQIGPVAGDVGDSRKKTNGKDEKSKRTLSDEEKEVKRKAKFAITQIKRLSICLSDFIYMTKKRENCLGDVVSTPDEVFFKSVTGISKDEFMYICNLGLIRKDKIEENILDFYFQEVASLISEEFIVNEIKKSK